MAVAINTGLVNPPNHIPSLVSTICDSGNCTFGQFSSLAVCHSCADISAHIKTWTMPGGIWNDTLPGNKSARFPDLDIATSTLLNTSAAYLPDHLLDLEILSRNITTSDGHASAFRCQLFPCVRTYEASVSKSILEETVVSEAPMGFDAFGGFDRYVLATRNLTQRGEQKFDCSPHSANDTAGLVRVALSNVDATPQEPKGTGSVAKGAWFLKECVWTFGSSPYLAIRPELYSYFENTNIQQYVPTYVGSIVAKNIWRNATINIDSVNGFMRNLSDVMTARIRNSGSNGADEYARGRTLVATTCVQVRWAWVSYPAALAGCGVVFFLVLFVQSPSDLAAMRSWKSSNIAILFCSLDEAIRQKTDASWFRDEIADVAKTSSAQLVQDGAGKAKFWQD